MDDLDYYGCQDCSGQGCPTCIAQEEAERDLKQILEEWE